MASLRTHELPAADIVGIGTGSRITVSDATCDGSNTEAGGLAERQDGRRWIAGRDERLVCQQTRPEKREERRRISGVELLVEPLQIPVQQPLLEDVGPVRPDRADVVAAELLVVEPGDVDAAFDGDGRARLLDLGFVPREQRGRIVADRNDRVVIHLAEMLEEGRDETIRGLVRIGVLVRVLAEARDPTQRPPIERPACPLVSRTSTPSESSVVENEVLTGPNPD